MSRKFGLEPDKTTRDPKDAGEVPTGLFGVSGILRTDKGFTAKTTIVGESERELNRPFLSALRQVCKMITLRAEWTHDDLPETFFD